MGGKSHRKFAVSEVTTMPCSFEEDVKLYSAAGCGGIGVWGFKMEEVGWQKARELMQRYDLEAANCIPVGNSILPYVLSPEPADPRERVEAFLPNMERMAKVNPETIVVITGPQGDHSPEEAMDLCIEGFGRIARAAADLGITVALEPIHKSARDKLSLIWDMPGALDIVRRVDHPSFRILFDTWHLWDTPDLFRHIDENIGLIAGVHVDDWRDPTRGWLDRAFPGEGVMNVAAIMDRLDAAGFRGFYDVEIFSDDGRFDEVLEGSLWQLEPAEIVRRATRIFKA
ncbi:MAG: sugar phosphate isomerase/epimerase [Rhizobiaceae bacterium]|nr:sugar phosphate isomerase/epimerase [Rhizobiaceae bacterium]